MAKKEGAWQITVKVSKPGYKNYFLRGVGFGIDREKVVKITLAAITESIEDAGVPKPFQVEVTKIQTLHSQFIIR